MSGPDAYDFRRAGIADLPRLGHWLAAPHVAAWWGDSVAELALVRQTIREAAGGQSATHPYIVSYEGRPMAYIQVWQADQWSEYDDQPEGTKGLDQLIGPPDMLGAGHGPRFIALMTERLFEAGVPRVIIDPAAENDRAIKAYAKAGFRSCGTRPTREGPVVLMAREPCRTKVTP